MLVAAVGYLTDSFANVLLTNYADYEEVLSMVVFGPAVIAELALALYLVVRGVNIRGQDENRALNSAQADPMGA